LLTAKLQGQSVQIRRVIARPSGLELVLADSKDDVQRPLVQLYDPMSPEALEDQVGLPIDISCMRSDVCTTCERPGMWTQYGAHVHYGRLTLPAEPQWFPEWQFRTTFGNPPWPPPDGWQIWAQAYSSLPLLEQIIVRIEGMPPGAELRVCVDSYSAFIMTARYWQGHAVDVSTYMPGDPGCDEMDGSIIIRRVGP
jgi:hypothetical protein